MPQTETIEVSQIIEKRKLNAFNYKLIVLSFCVIFFDGYDLTVLGYAAPSLIKSWGIANFAGFAPAFSASLFGVLLGCPIYGYIGDRFGRKTATVLTAFHVGLLTLLTIWASSLNDLVILRFIAGIGIGGMLPNLLALNAEFAGKRYRVTTTILVVMGIATGAGIPGVVSAFLVPQYGWPILFYLGGIVPIVMGLVALAIMPESIRYLTLRGTRPAEVRALLLRMEPGLTISQDAGFTLRDEKRYESRSVKNLFADGLWLMTPLLWFLYAAALMTQYFLNSWLPTLLSNASVSIGRAALITAVMQVGGAIGGLIVMRPVDRFGMLPITLLYVLGIPAVGIIGFIGDYPNLLMVVTFIVGFSVLGANGALNAIAANLYPTSVRSSGMGWALGVGRFGAVIGPLLGGLLISLHLSMQQLFLVATVPFILGAPVSFVLQRMYASKIGTGYGEKLELYAAPTLTDVSA